MPLNWNVEKVKDWETLTEGVHLRITNALIAATMAAGINHITDATVDEFYARIHMFERLFGTYLIGEDDRPLYINKYNIKRRVGLSTNAEPLSRKQFNDRMLKRWYKEV